MAWTYEQSTGRMLQDGVRVAIGYSGAGECKNDPASQDVHNAGPIPRGSYTIGEPHDTPTHGPYVLRLEPDADNEMEGRSGFLIHGSRIGDVSESSSEGCIILQRLIRQKIWDSGDHDLEVV